MKASYTTTLFCLFLCTACAKKETPAPAGDLDFLLGRWERTNEKEGRETFEIWRKKTATHYLGHGYTLASQDTVFNERMLLLKEDSIWMLHISGPNEHPVSFKVKKHNTHSFIAENPEHDFPKTIRYNYFDDTITATVANEEIEIPFIFWRVEE